MEGFLYSALVYLGAAIVAVPLATRFGLGSVLGYLIAGVFVGPVLQLVGSETQDIQHFAEFGVVMMLFIVGLELEPRSLWAMRGRLIGLGGLQVGLTAAAVCGLGVLLGLRWSVALAIGMVLSVSSTAIVLQTLNEKGLMKSEGGAASFSVLLFQDIAVIAMLALIPLLAMPELIAAQHGADDGHGGGPSLVAGLAGWQVALVNLAAIAAVVVGGQHLSRPLFRFIAGSRLREMFTATALLLVVAIAFLMTLVGLSPALGTFLAGVVLANSEYRHELESDIEPFKGLLLGLFFITVGAGIDFGLLFGDPLRILGLTLGLILLKSAVLGALGLAFGLGGVDRWLLALGLAQAGEFAFVLTSFSVQNAVIPGALSGTLLLVVALSMLMTPALFIFFDRVVLPRASSRQQRDADEIDAPGVAIIAGLGRFGQISNRMLLGNGFRTVVLDSRSDLIENMRKFGVRAFFGDASRPDLLHAAGLAEARVLVVAIDDPERAREIVTYARRERPDIHIVVRARDRHDVYRLYSAGADDIVRETFDSAVRAGRSALEALGVHAYEAEKIATVFVSEDRRGLRELADLWDPDTPSAENRPYLERARALREREEAAMRGDRSALHDRTDRAWTPPIDGEAATPDGR